MIITEEFLDSHPEAVFVFGDNLLRRGTAGAAKLRHHKQSLGVITKKYPDNKDSSFYTPEEYRIIFEAEFGALKRRILAHPRKTYYISQLGSGLANRFNIWEEVIKGDLESLENLPNVVLLWKRQLENSAGGSDIPSVDFI